MKHRILFLVAIVALIIVFWVFSFPKDSAQPARVTEPEPSSTTLEANKTSVNAPEPPIDPIVPLETVAASPLLQPVDSGVIDANVVAAFVGQRDSLLRFRVVTIDTDYLRTRIRDTAQDSSPLSIDIFPDVSIIARASYAEEHASGWRAGRAVWSGRVVGEEDSKIRLFAFPDGSASGTFLASSGIYQLDASDQLPYHFIWERDPNYSRLED